MPQDMYNTWQNFAKAASVEYDSEKLTQLIQQLNRTLDDEDRNNHLLMTPLSTTEIS